MNPHSVKARKLARLAADAAATEAERANAAQKLAALVAAHPEVLSDVAAGTEAPPKASRKRRPKPNPAPPQPFAPASFRRAATAAGGLAQVAANAGLPKVSGAMLGLSQVLTALGKED